MREMSEKYRTNHRENRENVRASERMTDRYREEVERGLSE